MIVVTMKNAGGVLDSKTVEAPVDAVEAAIEMIRSAGELLAGDKIIITDADDD